MKLYSIILAVLLASGPLTALAVGSPPPVTMINYDTLVEELTQSILEKYQAGVTGLNTLASSLSSSAKGLSESLVAGYTAYESQYCTEASFDVGSWKPAGFIGAGFNLTFDTGSCSFNETKFLMDGVKELECTEPSMTYTKFPASYHSKFHSAPSFTSKSCALSKDFGEDSVSVLATFDGTTSPSTAELTAKITSEIKTLLSTLGINAPSASG
ncbi:hypothetical protein QBZ16_003110 [Prototheca wickerhamii]|uniref:Uncharacterized protein n=1 Tax=Prototheca wickerhamii TaxID=3111 RepID=A0AAD9IJE6_PROWI|nr:hypothetical protein QBZ16_003110 [Prototheca wickerhamii]